MKAIILAAGKGKRFGDITKIVPKPLIKLGEFSLIEHNIILLKKYGFEEIIVNVSHLSHLIINSLGNGEKYNVNINYSIEHPEPLETGGGIQNALHLLGDEPFLAINSDIFTDCNLSKISINSCDLASLVMVDNPSHNIHGDFSILNNRVILKKRNDATYSGIGIYKPEFFQNNISKKYKLIDLLIQHIKNNKVSGSYYKGIWYDVGNEERLIEVKDLFFKN